MPDAPSKASERWWAKFLGGVRHASQGVHHPDVSGHWFTAEHKYRLLHQYSAEFRHAIDQYDRNKEAEAGRKRKRVPLILFTFHGSRGHNARRFFMIEVYPKDENMVQFLEKILKKIKEED